MKCLRELQLLHLGARDYWISSSNPSMPEVPPASQQHGHAVLVAGRDGLVVTSRSPGLNDGGDAGSRGHVRAVAKGEECVRGQDRAPGTRAGFLDRDPYRVQPAHLTRSNAEKLPVPGHDDRIRLYHRADPPGKGQVEP